MILNLYVDKNVKSSLNNAEVYFDEMRDIKKSVSLSTNMISYNFNVDIKTTLFLHILTVKNRVNSPNDEIKDRNKLQ